MVILSIFPVNRCRGCLAPLPGPYYTHRMKSLTVRLSEALVAQIEAESRERKLSKSDVVRERLETVPAPAAKPDAEASST